MEGKWREVNSLIGERPPEHGRQLRICPLVHKCGNKLFFTEGGKLKEKGTQSLTKRYISRPKNPEKTRVLLPKEDGFRRKKKK